MTDLCLEHLNSCVERKGFKKPLYYDDKYFSDSKQMQCFDALLNIYSNINIIYSSLQNGFLNIMYKYNLRDTSVQLC